MRTCWSHNVPLLHEHGQRRRLPELDLRQRPRCLQLATSTGFYNSEFGSTVASGLNPAFIAFFPTSLPTAGHHWHRQPERWRRSSHQRWRALSPWINAFAAGEAIGQNIVMDDFTGGAWSY